MQQPYEQNEGRETDRLTGKSPEQPDLISAPEQPSQHWLDALLADPMAAELVGPNFDRLAKKWRNCFHYLDRAAALTWHSAPFSRRGLLGNFSWDNVKSLIWPAILGPYWFLYRKLYLAAALLLAISTGFDLLLLPYEIASLNIIVIVICLNCAPALYLSRIRDGVIELRSLSSAEEKAIYVYRRGKTSWPAVAVALCAVMLFSIAVSRYAGDQPVSSQTTLAAPSERSAPDEGSAVREQPVPIGPWPVSTCNDRDVIRTLVDGTVGRYKTAALKMLDAIRGGPYGSGPNYDFAVQTVNTLNASITGISQTEYDANNGIRTCEAEFSYMTAGSLQMVNAITSMYPSNRDIPPLCKGAVTYEIRRLLDQPGQFQVKWQCE